MTQINFSDMKQLLTAAQWYDLDIKDDILDPDGWPRENRNVSNIWYNTPITFNEYMNKKRKCSIVPYNKINHRQPFDKPKT